MPIDGIKKCCYCHKFKALRDFAVRNASEDGRQPMCRACHHVYYLKEKNVERAREIREASEEARERQETLELIRTRAGAA